MKAESLDTYEDLKRLRFPLLGSVKIDGWRCSIQNGIALSSKLKLIRNLHVRKLLSQTKFEGLDGELTVGPRNAHNVYNRTSSGIGSAEGEPKFFFHVFDIMIADTTYDKRYELIARKFLDHPFIRVLPQRMLYTINEVLEFEAEALRKGYEGIMLRNPQGLYKHGRATLKEQYLLKRKPFKDTEGKVVGFYEQEKNCNEQKTVETGLNKRSHCKAGMVPKGTLGGFLLECKEWPGQVLRCGTGKGLTENLRKTIWRDRDCYLGKLIKFRYQEIGTKDKPRIPIFLGFRDPIDMTDY